MQKQLILVLLTVLFLTIFSHQITAIQIPLPFTLQLQKNISLRWFVNTQIDDQKSIGSFNYFSGGGFCRKYGTGDDTFIVSFFLKGQLQKQIFGRASDDSDWSNWYYNLGSILADEVNYTGWCWPGVMFNDVTDPGDTYMLGKFEVLQPLEQTSQITSVNINNPPIQIGTLSELIPGITLADPTKDNRIISENIQVNSSNQNILVWFGTDSTIKPTTTKNLNDPIQACADLDHNGICDSTDATNANCDISTNENAWYKGWCCSKQSINANGCKYDPTFNAYCGNDSNGNTQLAIPEAIGQIFDLTGCATKTQVVFDEQNKIHDCTKPSDWDVNGFTTIKGHQYYCNITTSQILECGGENPISTINALTTGQNTTITGKVNYCLETASFSTNLDYTTQKSCEKAGQTWTGTRCCSEADDRQETAGTNEYYNDISNDTNTQTPGGCWNSTYIRTGFNPPNDFNNSILNYNGTFYGCQITDQKILGLQVTDAHYITLPSSPLLTLQPTTLLGPLLINHNSCGKVLINPKWEQTEPTIPQNVICQPWGQWFFTTEENDTTQKITPLGNDKTTMPLVFKCDATFHETGCCAQTKCWTGKTCANNKEIFDAGNTGFICNNGNWEQRIKKTNYDKTDEGFCQQEQQCLVHHAGNNNYDNQPDKYFTAQGNPTQMPQCITNTQYLKDEYCDNGNWTTRTKLIATQLISLAELNQNTNNNYDLFCDNYNNVLNNVAYSYSPGQTIVENLIKTCTKTIGQTQTLVPCTNNFCILKTSQGITAIGTSLNTPINGATSFLQALNLNKNACDNTLSTTGFTQCSQIPSAGGQVWYNPQLQSIIYLPSQLRTNLQDMFTQQQLQNILTYVSTKSIKENPILNYEFINQTNMYNRIMYSKKDSRTIFAVLEKQKSLTGANTYYLAIKYSNFSIGQDPCLTLFKTGLQDNTPICEKQIDQSQLVVLAKDIPENLQLNQFPKWRDLTAKLRLITGPSESITTDVGSTIQPPAQPIIPQECPS